MVMLNGGIGIFQKFSRALRFQGDLPVRFQGDCVLTAAYIINRLPTRLLDNKKLYEMHMTPLPSVEARCSIIQQAESQKELLEAGHLEVESTALYSTSEPSKGCSECGNKVHNKQKCWRTIDYPSWHPKAKKFPQKKFDENQTFRGSFKGSNEGGVAAKAETSRSQSSEISLSQAQLEQLQQLLKLPPQNTKASGTETNKELDCGFTGMILCTHTGVHRLEWILDSGATGHMTINLNLLCETKALWEHSVITLPNGNTSTITSVGKAKLSTDLVLQDVLYFPVFKYNLLSVSKLTKDSNCVVIFHPKFCIIQDYLNRKILRIIEGIKDCIIYKKSLQMVWILGLRRSYIVCQKQTKATTMLLVLLTVLRFMSLMKYAIKGLDIHPLAN